MKHNIILLLFAAVLTCLVGCDDDIEFSGISFTADKLDVSVGEDVTFTINGKAETFAIYTGDTGHEFNKSYLAVTSGQELDQELVILTQDSIPEIRDFLTPIVDNYNSDVSVNLQYDIDEIMINIESQVGIEYSNKLTAAYLIWEYMSELNGQVARDIVDLFYENESILLAPPDGFSTGFAIDRYDKTFSYVYDEPGMYLVTLIATNISEMQYPENDYYEGRAFKEIVITVRP